MTVVLGYRMDGRRRHHRLLLSLRSAAGDGIWRVMVDGRIGGSKLRVVLLQRFELVLELLSLVSRGRVALRHLSRVAVSVLSPHPLVSFSIHLLFAFLLLAFVFPLLLSPNSPSPRSHRLSLCWHLHSRNLRMPAASWTWEELVIPIEEGVRTVEGVLWMIPAPALALRSCDGPHSAQRLHHGLQVHLSPAVFSPRPSRRLRLRSSV